MPLPPLSAKPVERRLLRDVVYDRLYNAIIDGTLEPGEVLLDETLTGWLGVSRTPIREALMRLSEIGLVEFSPNRYTRVAPIDLRTIDEAVYTTGLLNEYAARIAVADLTDEEIARFRELSALSTTYAEAGDFLALANAMRDFFLEFELATHNSALVAASESLNPQLLRYVSAWQLPIAPTEIAAAIAQITEAAAARDGERAADLIRAMYEPAKRLFFDEYRRTDAAIDADAQGQ
jgi:DNA-binding GntR family transcriptional regulator